MMTDSTTSHHMEQLAAAAVGSLPETEVRIRSAARWSAFVSLLTRGRPPSVRDLAAVSGEPAAELTDDLTGASSVEWDADGRVVGIGLTLNPTPHRVEVDGSVLYAWCAPAALGIVTALGKSIRISSPCHATGQQVTVVADPDGVQEVDPPSAVVSWAAAAPAENVRLSNCSELHFFASRDAAADWLGTHPDGELFPVFDAFHFSLRTARLLMEAGS